MLCWEYKIKQCKQGSAVQLFYRQILGVKLKQTLTMSLLSGLLSLACVFTLARAQLPHRLADEFSVNVGSVTRPRQCPSSDLLASARANLSQAISSLIELNYPCGYGNWRRIADIDMQNSSQQCPAPWIERANPQRSCSSSIDEFGCQGITLPVSGKPYTQVCGRATGYALSSPDGFAAIAVSSNGIDDPYLDGLSVTYGSPRQHIWSLAAGHAGRCPCDNSDTNFAPLPPSFVGDNYFCDGDYNGALWDAEDCTNQACCTLNSPPMFNVTLSAPSSDAIEVRICVDQHRNDEAVHVRLLQLFVQ